MNGPDPVAVADGLDLGAAVPSGMPSAVLVAEIRVTTTPSTPVGWRPGPLPVVQGVNATTLRRSNLRTTDESARRTLVAQNQADALYGADATTARLHRIIPASPGGSEPILALELFVGPADVEGTISEGLLAVHVGLPGTPNGAGSALQRHLELSSVAVQPQSVEGQFFWESVREHLPAGVVCSPQRRIRTISFQALDAGAVEDEGEALAVAYLLATSAAPRQMGDIRPRSLRHSLTLQRRDWSALVLRDGAAFICHQQSDEQFAGQLRALTHSVHLDAMLLALMQRRLLDASGARAVEVSIERPDELVRLELWHFDFKRKYWRTSLTEKRTSPSDEVLRALQAELLTALDVADVEERVRDGARLAQSLQAQRHTASQQRLNRMVQNASVIIGALGVTFTAAPVVAQPSLRLFAAAGLVGILAMCGAFVVLHLTGRRADSGDVLSKARDRND